MRSEGCSCFLTRLLGSLGVSGKGNEEVWRAVPSCAVNSTDCFCGMANMSMVTGSHDFFCALLHITTLLFDPLHTFTHASDHPCHASSHSHHLSSAVLSQLQRTLVLIPFCMKHWTASCLACQTSHRTFGGQQVGINVVWHCLGACWFHQALVVTCSMDCIQVEPCYY